MTPALERLAELVRQAEAKARAKKLTAETQQAAEQLRAAEARARQATQRLREVRTVRLRELEQADADEHHLKDLIRKLAQFKASLDRDSDAESLIDTAQAEIRRKREEARATLEGIGQDVEEARRELRAAMDHFQVLRRELDRLQPQLGASFAAEDRLQWEAEAHFPGGQIQALAREVEASLHAFGSLAKMEQYAQLKIWIGRLRYYQAGGDDGGGDEVATAQRVFHQLKGLSKQYEPGYIEAFRHDYTTDWTAYVAEALEQRLQAGEAARRPRDRDKDKDKDRDREGDSSAADRTPRDPGRPVPHEPEKNDPLPPASYEDLLPATHGLRVLMIGGIVREDVRRSLLNLFDFDRIDWEPSGETGPILFEMIERQIRDRGVDLVLILKGPAGDRVHERLRPLCQAQEIPCLWVEHGPDPVQVGEVLRREFCRSA
jgi:hypothetical protein